MASTANPKIGTVRNDAVSRRLQDRDRLRLQVVAALVLYSNLNLFTWKSKRYKHDSLKIARQTFPAINDFLDNYIGLLQVQDRRLFTIRSARSPRIAVCNPANRTIVAAVVMFWKR